MIVYNAPRHVLECDRCGAVYPAVYIGTSETGAPAFAGPAREHECPGYPPLRPELLELRP